MYLVFILPPWGSPGYPLSKRYSMCNDHVGEGFSIFDTVKTIALNIAFHIPKNTNILEVKHMIYGVNYKYKLNFIL